MLLTGHAFHQVQGARPADLALQLQSSEELTKLLRPHLQGPCASVRASLNSDQPESFAAQSMVRVAECTILFFVIFVCSYVGMLVCPIKGSNLHALPTYPHAVVLAYGSQTRRRIYKRFHSAQYSIRTIVARKTPQWVIAAHSPPKHLAAQCVRQPRPLGLLMDPCLPPASTRDAAGTLAQDAL